MRLRLGFCRAMAFFGARTPRGEGTHKGCPYGSTKGARTGGRVRTRGVRTQGARTRGEGAHKGCPYGMGFLGRAAKGGGFTGGFLGRWWMGWPGRLGRAFEFGRQNNGARTRGGGAHKGCPYGWTRGEGWIFRARAPRGEGTHKGCPYGWVFWGGAHAKGGGCPQGVSVRVDF